MLAWITRFIEYYYSDPRVSPTPLPRLCDRGRCDDQIRRAGYRHNRHARSSHARPAKSYVWRGEKNARAYTLTSLSHCTECDYRPGIDWIQITRIGYSIIKCCYTIDRIRITRQRVCVLHMHCSGVSVCVCENNGDYTCFVLCWTSRRHPGSVRYRIFDKSCLGLGAGHAHPNMERKREGTDLVLKNRNCHTSTVRFVTGSVWVRVRWVIWDWSRVAFGLGMPERFRRMSSNYFHV